MEKPLELEWKEYRAGIKDAQLIDIRDDVAYSYGAVSGAIHWKAEAIEQQIAIAEKTAIAEKAAIAEKTAIAEQPEKEEQPADLDGFENAFQKKVQDEYHREFHKDAPILLYCKRGETSLSLAERLRGLGYTVYSMKDGYAGYILDTLEADLSNNDSEESMCEQIEKSIRKKFHKQLFSKFAKAINDYKLVKEGDKIAVCISGGKDSMLMAKLFQELKRHNKFPFELVFLVMDPGYSAENRKVIEQNAKLMNIPVTIFESDIFNAVFDIEKSPCYLCARMRRGHLYSKAKELGCNKIALGHHYDDVIETILMGMLYGGQMQTMMPKLHSTNFEGMELIRPLYLIREDDIKHWRDYHGLHFLQCACRFTETCSSCSEEGASASKRQEIKHLIRTLKETNPYVEGNIFKSVENVNLSTIVAYKKNGEKHSFLENYDESYSIEE